MKNINLPSSQEVEQELNRERYRRRYRNTLQSTIFALVTASAAAVLVATLLLPVLQIYGSSMNPTLQEGEIVVSVKVKELEAGDIVAFYYGNRVLIKRYIAGPGTWVNMDEDGNVYLNDELLGTVDNEEYQRMWDEAVAYNQSLLTCVNPYGLTPEQEQQYGNLIDVTGKGIMDKTLTYEIDQIKIVEPHESEDLLIREGKDLLTLFTCTYGGKGRLALRCDRVEVKPYE